MARIKRGSFVFSTMAENETALLSHHGDSEALSFLWAASVDQVGRIAGRFVRRYPWVDHDDLVQTILSEFPKIIKRYDPAKAAAKKISWNKYAYFAFYRAGQDALRREDPLGVSIPQKSHYPSWRRFSEISNSENLLQGIILDGYNKLDRGDPAVMDGNEPLTCNRAPTENSNCCPPNLDAAKTPEWHDYVYHGRKY